MEMTEEVPLSESNTRPSTDWAQFAENTPEETATKAQKKFWIHTGLRLLIKWARTLDRQYMLGASEQKKGFQHTTELSKLLLERTCLYAERGLSPTS
ncbi:hypothetical protein D9757_008971 [Collybiopsis confluens]|uniref:Uncharacterized protein n=1 Tax=Collybiopsis confluens TaxID=2823264 RepID=A0A8H5H2Z5_9AGAR|nr:hypothetical protein D9757_008971 [Collybiopsis confluens]